ncbi:MAG: response regulator [Streptosporangiaceae bacterium]|nr:response regulator [Streptosporangiaceae bacterium]
MVAASSGGASYTARAGEPVTRSGGDRDVAGLADEVTARFGVLPAFFRPPPGAESLVVGLWAFTQSAYLDNPLPALFKERLFVHLSRFCEERYCIIRHACFLAGLGRPAGDAQTQPETAAEILALLRRPIPQTPGLEEALRRLEAVPGPVPIPGPGTQLESDLFDLLAVVFLDPRQAPRARAAVTTTAGNQAAELLLGLLAFIRTAHYWTEVHPGLELEPDATAFLDQHPDLARLLTDPADALAASPRAAYQRAAADLLQATESLAASEERYRALFESMDAGFSLIQPVPGGTGHAAYQVVESNPAQARLTGQPKAAGKPAADLLPEAAGELTARLAEVDATGQPARLEVHLPDAGRWLDISVQRATASGEQMLAATFRDITDRMQAAADREAHQRTQRDFVANAAHELRTPLTAVIAAIETLDRGAINDPAARDRFFGHVRREAARLSRLCDSLLLLADAESGTDLPAAAVRLRTVLDGIAADLRPAPDVTVTVTVDAAADLTVTTNRGLLERILANLAQNAAKYTTSGQITLRAAATGSTVTVEVRDTGPGLCLPATQAVERFSRGGVRAADGFGLGLSIAHQAARAIGGTLRLHDNPGGGTIARLTLRAAPPAAASVLVIEDEHAIRDSIAYTLANAGYQVTQAATGHDGITSAQHELFDLIIIDLLLPDITGTDLTRQIRAAANGDGTRILAITARTDPATRDQALAAGADRFMTKPFSMNQLLDQARSLLRNQP